MRELKFRAWDGGQMLSNHEINGDWLLAGKYGSWSVMQFSGLKDKNGVEIYQSDIIEVSGGEFALIVWRDDLASFALRKSGWLYDHYFGEAVDPGRCKVVGNIYQNPELLKP